MVDMGAARLQACMRDMTETRLQPCGADMGGARLQACIVDPAEESALAAEVKRATITSAAKAGSD